MAIKYATVGRKNVVVYVLLPPAKAAWYMFSLASVRLSVCLSMCL